MPLLFAYGNLQEEGVQRSVYGRVLAGRRDELACAECRTNTIDDPQVVAATGRASHANIDFNGKSESHDPATEKTAGICQSPATELSLPPRP